MNNFSPHVVTLRPMRVASSYGFGRNPEEQAWRKLSDWAGRKGFLVNKKSHPVFGFNNPNPIPGNSDYGYEFWMKVDPGTEPEGEIRIEEFVGGTYAVLRCEAGEDPASNIPAAWQALADWCKSTNRKFGRHQPLERILSDPGDPEHLVLELFCPIADENVV